MSKRIHRIIIGFGVAALMSIAAPCAGATTIEVTTGLDEPMSQEADPNTTAPEQSQVRIAENACLKGRDETDNTAELVDNLVKDVDSDSNAGDCSLRMALTIAAANPATSDSKRDTIRFDLPAGQHTVTVDSENPLPPIVREGLTIQGCSTASSSSKPCVNVELPSSIVPLDILPGTVLPGELPGLIVAADEVSIEGIAFQGGNPAIWAVPAVDRAGIDRLKVQNCFFGLTTDGDLGEEMTTVGLLLSGARAVIGGTENGERNVFATGEAGVIIAGGARNQVIGNWFGTDGSGQQALTGTQPERLRTGVRVAGLGYDTTPLIEELPNGLAEQLGLEDISPADALPGSAKFNSVATNNVISDNLFAGTSDAAIDVGGLPMISAEELASAGLPDTEGELVGATRTTIARNRIGVDTDGDPAPNRKAGIYVRNGSDQTTIGGTATSAENTISNTAAGPGVLVEISAGLGTRFERNVGRRNRGPIFELDPGVSGGVQQPVISYADPGAVSGTSAPGAQILLYLASQPEHVSKAGDIDAFLGSVRADGSGRWTITPSPRVDVGRKVTATADVGDGTSALARNVDVSPPPKIEIQQQAVTTQPPVVLPSTAPPDRSAPQVVSVLGQRPSASEAIVVAPGGLRELKGQLRDASGVAKVELALRVVDTPKSRARAAAARCKFIDLRRGALLRRACAKPPYAAVPGTERWRFPLNARVRKRLTPGGRYLLYIRATDRRGNRRTSLVRLTVSRSR